MHSDHQANGPAFLRSRKGPPQRALGDLTRTPTVPGLGLPGEWPSTGTQTPRGRRDLASCATGRPRARAQRARFAPSAAYPGRITLTGPGQRARGRSSAACHNAAV